MLLDTSAIVEITNSSEKGKAISEKIDELFANSGERAVISILTIAEIANWCKRENKNLKEVVFEIKSRTEIVNLNELICLFAGSLVGEQRKIQKKFGLVDALIYATAQAIGEELWTTDVDFKGLGEIRIFS